MAIKEIIEFGKQRARQAEDRAREFDFKSYEHDIYMSEAAEIEAVMLKIESCLHIPGVFEKFDYREDINYYWDILRSEGSADKQFEIIKNVGKSVNNTLLWAKKLSWLGDWDLNYDGRHTFMSVRFVPEPGIKEYDVPRHYFHRGENITSKNYKLEINSSESNFSAALWIDFTDDWEGVEFNLQRGESCLTFRGKAFLWDKAKFAGFACERPFYAARTTEFFGKNHGVYYSANY